MFATEGVDGGIDAIVDQCYGSMVVTAWMQRDRPNAPNTPAELPMNVPLLVTELSMLLIRSRMFDTANGR